MDALALLREGDTVSRAVALLLLAMSCGSWFVILWKAWLLAGASRGTLRAIDAFWRAPTLAQAEQSLKPFDRATLVLPAVAAIKSIAIAGGDGATLGGASHAAARLTRALRDALHAALRKLQAGQILLATVGATAPFVGLLGTVWGIHRALASIAGQAGGFTIDKVAGPVGEALVMTAFGLAVAIPAVLAYNVFGRTIARIEGELEGFAHDLLEQFTPSQPTARTTP